MYTKFGSPRVIFKPSILFYSKTNWGAQGPGAFCREAFIRVPLLGTQALFHVPDELQHT